MDRLWRKHPCILLIFLLILLAGSLVLPYIITDTPFILGWDMRTQYSSFYENLKTMMAEAGASNTLPFYSWVSFLGNNFWGSKLFYYHNVFDYLALLLFPDMEYDGVVMIQSFFKLLLAGLCFYRYCSYHQYSGSTRIIGSLLFAFSSYSLDALKDPFFHSFYVFLPLYFLAMDRYLLEKKKVGYVLITAFLAITNYYHFYSLSVFSVLYFIYRYFCIHHRIGGFFRAALPLIGAYGIAVLIAGFALVPEFCNIITNDRVGQSSAFFLYDSVRTYFYVLTGLFIPSSIIANRSNDFASMYSYVSDNNTVLYVCLWAGSLCSLLLPQSVARGQQKGNRIFLGVILLFMLIPLGSSIMHGFSEPAFRWFQFPLFVNLTLILPYIENSSRIHRKGLRMTVLLVSAVLVLGTPLLGLIQQIPPKEYAQEYCLILIAVVFLWLGYCALRCEKRSWLIAFTFTELLVVSWLSVYSNSAYRQFSRETIEGVTHVLGDKNELNEYLLTRNESNRDQFYRIYVDVSSVYWDYSTNLNLNFNIMGLMTYDSTVSSSASDLNQISDIDSYLPWSYEISDPVLVDFLCTKYAVVTEESQLPHDDFVKVGEFHSFLVYENLHYKNFVRSYQNLAVLNQDEIRSHDILDTAICHESDYEQLKTMIRSSVTECTFVHVQVNTVTAGVTSSEGGLISVSVPYDKGWSVKVNGQPAEIYSINGGMIGFAVPSGDSEIEMNFTPQGLQAGVMATVLGLVLLGGLAIGSRRNQGRS